VACPSALERAVQDMFDSKALRLRVHRDRLLNQRAHCIKQRYVRTRAPRSSRDCKYYDTSSNIQSIPIFSFNNPLFRSVGRSPALMAMFAKCKNDMERQRVVSGN
jgi:hypothetical protein